MLPLDSFELDVIASALASQDTYDLCWLVDPASGELVLWTSDSGIDGQNPVELDELDHLISIEPLPPSVWYRDMVDFATTVGDDLAQDRLLRALDGRGAFRRFRNELYERHPDLLAGWHVFRDARGEERAVGWLVENGLVAEVEADTYLRDRGRAPG